MNIEKVTLRGSRVRLEPLVHGHLAGLAEAIADGALWEIPVTTVPPPTDLPKFLKNAESAFDMQRELAFATIDVGSATVVGSTRFRNIETEDKRAEIGFTFIAKSWQRTYVNTEAKYLMLCHAFEEWEFNRVEFLTDVLNTQSRNAISRIGAKEEGVLRSHMVMPSGRIRDSAIYSITSSEWPHVKRNLEVKMSED